MTNIVRPKLTLKKPRVVPVVVNPVQVVKPKPAVKQVKKPVAQQKKKPKAQPNPDKERIRLENIRLNAEEVIRRKSQIEKAKPLIDAYFESNPVFGKTIMVDGVECLRPLMIGARKKLFALFKAHPDLNECTNTVITDLISDALEYHVSKPQYIAGLVKLTDRFDLEGNPVEAVSDSHKARAVEKARAG